MSRQFTSQDAKHLIEKHNKIKLNLSKGAERLDIYKENVVKYSNDLRNKEVYKILSGIPVDELNRDKHGIKVKTLKDAGYNTIADIVAANRHSIASIYGISEDMAASIKFFANEIARKAAPGIKIKLSTDNKTREASNLVESIYKYQKTLPIARNGEMLLDEYSLDIDQAIEELQVATKGLKWFFACSGKKQGAEKAYLYLSDLLASDYVLKTNACVKELNSIIEIKQSDCWENFAQNSVSYFNILEELNPGLLGNDDQMYGLPEDLAKEIQDQCFFPDGLLCTLRRYQEWGVKYILHQERVLLGDEMGLGKTIQAIATMVSLKNTGATHFMVVCPASVLANWCREVRKMSKLSVIKIHGGSRRTAFKSWLASGGVAVTTYETTKIFEFPEEFKFSLMVVDEAHYVKNPDAARSINVRNMCKHTERLLFMTGTALENKVDEMISLINVLQPEVAKKVRGMEALSAAPRFRQLVAPVYYRRRRDDVLTELPEKTEAREWCTMTAQEEQAYENSVMSESFMSARRVSWNVDPQFSSKAQRLKELVEEAESDGRKIIVFSFFKETINKVMDILGDCCYGPISGSVAPQRRQEIIDQFEQAPAGSVLVSQIQAGGTGLNIQAASVVIMCEPQLKPSIENQAISRAYRMGQTRNVLVYRLLCENSIDEKMVNLLEEKQKIFDEFADKSEAAKQEVEITEKGVGDIIKEEIERIKAKNKDKAPETDNDDFEAENADMDDIVDIESTELHRKFTVDENDTVESLKESTANGVSSVRHPKDNADVIQPCEPAATIPKVATGMTAIHAEYGEGHVIVDETGTNMFVIFTSGTKYFKYPDAFESGELKLK